MQVLSETLTVLGCGLRAASLALRQALRFKTRKGSLVVQDSTGRGAQLLSAQTKEGLENKRIIWVDLADRRHPVSLFQIRRSEHFRALWVRVLKSIRRLSHTGLSDGTLDWAADAAYAISADGSVGLGALFRCLTSAETRRWFLETKNEPADLGKLLEMLGWALSFPAVHAVSEGENRGQLLDAFAEPSILWLEAAVEHFEPKEHLLVQILVEAAIEDALRTMAGFSSQWMEPMKGMTIAHLYTPVSVALPLEDWVQIHSGTVRHVGVHRLEPDAPLLPQTLREAQTSEFLWVAGATGALSQTCHGKWLSSAELSRVGELVNGELWIRSNGSGKSLAMRLRDPATWPGMDDFLRGRASRRRRTTSVGQVAATVRLLSSPPDAQRDLYARLCEVETLRMGWFRVRESHAKSGGVDSVTIASFAEKVETELAALATALRSGQYRCRPLRRISIPKPDGGTRNLGIACIRDRVVQAACLSLLEPVFEPHFSRYSYGFRPGRSAHQAVAIARAMIAGGRKWAVIADIRKCFDNIDHDILLGLLAKRIADEELLDLIRAWLQVDVLEFRDLLPTEVGVPQGESISPLLANVYLDPLDKHFEWLGMAFARYADDFVILVESEAAAGEACRRLSDFLRDVLHLELKPAKTSFVPVADGFDFLGFRITASSITVKPERAQKLLNYVIAQICEFAENASDIVKAAQPLGRINAVVRGWRNYFLLPGEPALKAQLENLDAQIDEAALRCLPADIRENPAWQCRERLALPTPDGTADLEERGSERQQPPESDYPETQAEEVPANWMVRSSDGNEAKPPATQQPTDTQPQAEEEKGSDLPVTAPLEDGERLYVLSHGTYVTAKDGDLVLRKKRAEVYRRPIEKISLIYLQGFGIGISVDAQVQLAEHDVPIVLAPPLGKPVAIVNPIETARSSIRRLQAVRRDEPDVVQAGMKMIAAKMSNQAAVLKYFAKYRKQSDPETAKSLMESAAQILALAASAAGLDPAESNVRGSLMGFEGHAAAIYWRQVAKLIPGDFGFGGRITLSAQDPVNQCLNYVYGLLYGEVWRAVVRAGLDPYFGLVHGSVRDQGSLVFDLIEEFRAPFGDRVVVGMLGRGFRPEIGQHGFLRTKSKRQLVRAFTTRWMKSMHYRSRDIAPAKLLAMQASSLAGVFQREGRYHPYHMRW